MSLENVSMVAKIMMPIMFLAVVLQIVGFSTTAWVTTSHSARGVSHTFGLGLWRRCVSITLGGLLNGDQCIPTASDEVTVNGQTVKIKYPSWYRGAEAVETLGLLAVLAATALHFGYVLLDELRKRAIIMGVLALSIGAAVMIAVGVIIFGAKYEDKIIRQNVSLPAGFTLSLSWSFGVCIGAAVLAIISSACAGLEMKNTRLMAD